MTDLLTKIVTLTKSFDFVKLLTFTTSSGLSLAGVVFGVDCMSVGLLYINWGVIKESLNGFD